MGKTFDDIKHSINANLDHELDYADDRNELVKSLLHSNEDWMIDLLSQEEVRGKQVKSKKDFLAEDSKLDKTLEQIADYILFPKHRNRDDEQFFEELTHAYHELSKNKDKTEELNDALFEMKSEIDLYNQRLFSKSKDEKNRYREELTGSIEKFEHVGELEGSFSKEKQKRYRIGKKLELDDSYWDRMGFSKDEGQFRKAIIRTYEETIELLFKQLGYDKDPEEQREIQQKLLNSLDTISFYNGTNMVNIRPHQRLGKIKKLYSDVVSDYYKTKEILAEIIAFSQPTKPTTEYDFNTDTWYIDNDGEIVEISSNMLSLSSPNTYKGLILNYYELKDKYKDSFNSDMWAILHIFEDLVAKSDLTDEELFVVICLANDMSRKDVIDRLLRDFNKEISDQVLSNWINKVIPKKIAKTYIETVDEWLYTYKIQGEFKACSSCGEIKLISNERYFRKHPLGRDGFQPKCRECERIYEKG